MFKIERETWGSKCRRLEEVGDGVRDSGSVVLAGPLGDLAINSTGRGDSAEIQMRKLSFISRK